MGAGPQTAVRHGRIPPGRSGTRAGRRPGGRRRASARAGHGAGVAIVAPALRSAVERHAARGRYVNQPAGRNRRTALFTGRGRRSAQSEPVRPGDRHGALWPPRIRSPIGRGQRRVPAAIPPARLDQPVPLRRS